MGPSTDWSIGRLHLLEGFLERQWWSPCSRCWCHHTPGNASSIWLSCEPVWEVSETLGNSHTNAAKGACHPWHKAEDVPQGIQHIASWISGWHGHHQSSALARSFPSQDSTNTSANIGQRTSKPPWESSSEPRGGGIDGRGSPWRIAPEQFVPSGLPFGRSGDIASS